MQYATARKDAAHERCVTSLLAAGAPELADADDDEEEEESDEEGERSLENALWGNEEPEDKPTTDKTSGGWFGFGRIFGGDGWG
jgi:hypothetical protein